jgi:hypothetical protein
MSRRASRKAKPSAARAPVAPVGPEVDLGKAKQLADLRKTNAESSKIEAEAAKIYTERWVIAIGAVTGLLGALGGLKWLLVP